MSWHGEHRPHYLYRCFDTEGALLYIGVTSDLKVRFHKHHYPSGPALRTPAAALWSLMSDWCAEEYPDRASALTAERDAIATEHPLLNVQSQQAAS